MTCQLSYGKPHSASSINPLRSHAKLQISAKKRPDPRTERAEGVGFLFGEESEPPWWRIRRTEHVVEKPSQGHITLAETYRFGVKIPQFQAQFRLLRARILSADRTARNILFSSGIYSFEIVGTISAYTEHRENSIRIHPYNSY